VAGHYTPTAGKTGDPYRSRWMSDERVAQEGMHRGEVVVIINRAKVSNRMVSEVQPRKPNDSVFDHSRE
jgi:hypothetical protein